MNLLPYYIANKPYLQGDSISVIDKYTHEVFKTVSLADHEALEAAMVSAKEATTVMRDFPPYKRQAVLNQCVLHFQHCFDELANIVCIEAGKPITAARIEVQRLIDTFRMASEACSREQGHIIPLNLTPQGVGYQGYYHRIPIGPCIFITPFNFPLNLVAHKIAPAIAAGCPFILKPSELAPVSALMIAEILSKTDLPIGAFSIALCSTEDAKTLVQDERMKMLSFTGSAKIGWHLKSQVGKKKISLELGGNAACIVHDDSDLQYAAKRISASAFHSAGQTCISVQRIFVHKSIYEKFKALLLAEINMLIVGDPKNTSTHVGPVINETAAKRISDWITSAVQSGACILCGGIIHKTVISPTLLENVLDTEPLNTEEVFGPVALLKSYEDFSAVLNDVNNSKYGLQAGVFTRDIGRIQAACEKLEVGGIIIGDVPSVRFDNMPYGGIKDSGTGREGVQYAIESMSTLKMVVIKNEKI
jgi:acyl-CoA reductase-like NAD-dependent aldehyde dehydrogenase